MNPLVSLGEYIFPRSCHLCGLRLSPHERYICTSCLARLPRTLYHRQSDNPMAQRFMGIVPYVRATGHFFYSRHSDLAELIHDFKYKKFRGLAGHLGAVVATELIPTGFLSDIDLVVPVPMHFLKQARRGYNQAAEVARGLARAASIPMCQSLKAVHAHRTQTSMTLDGRRRNVEGLFQLTDSTELEGRNVLLVDDVCTTGSTLAEAALAILDHADAQISMLTLGVTF